VEDISHSRGVLHYEGYMSTRPQKSSTVGDLCRHALGVVHSKEDILTCHLELSTERDIKPPQEPSPGELSTVWGGRHDSRTTHGEHLGVKLLRHGIVVHCGCTHSICITKFPGFPVSPANTVRSLGYTAHMQL
jgi:hypothetical protein